MTLIRTFAVVTLTPMVFLACAVTWIFASTLQRQAQHDGEKLAQSYVTQGVQSKIGVNMLSFWSRPDSAPPAVVQSLDTIGRSNGVAVLDSLSLYNIDGEPLWTSTGTPQDAPPLDMNAANGALDNLSAVSSIEDTADGKTLSVTVPVVYGDRLTGAYGIAEVQLPWDATEQLI